MQITRRKAVTPGEEQAASPGDPLRNYNAKLRKKRLEDYYTREKPPSQKQRNYVRWKLGMDDWLSDDSLDAFVRMANTYSCGEFLTSKHYQVAIFCLNKRHNFVDKVNASFQLYDEEND